ncbi:Uncharacterised protein [Serratia liquefaciens]|jgi:hypothetical protein|nr:hypothetical protein [Pantoea coffeiphila]MDR6349976.1 hypothetical protein [Pantoea sp. SORGH_AS_0659]CAI2411037.1 Uncharacterised protein [Serratia liquefaciens]SXD78998.1 Uncharacterised protein [Klebsiella variicola]
MLQKRGLMKHLYFQSKLLTMSHPVRNPSESMH